MKAIHSEVRDAFSQLHEILAILSPSDLPNPFPGGPEFRIELMAPRLRTVLHGEVRAHLWPNEVWSVANRLGLYRGSTDGCECVPIIAVPSVSSRTAELCLDAELNWVDSAGNCDIRFGGSLIHIEGKSGTKASNRGTLSLYSPQSSRVVHAMLLGPTKSWRVEELAKASKVSIGQVSNVRQLLVRNSFAVVDSGGLRVSDQKGLLLDWAQNYRPQRRTLQYFSLMSPEELENSLGHALPAYALTEMSSAERYAPYTRYQTVSFYALGWTSSYAKDLDLRPSEGASNVTVYTDPTGLPFTEKIGSVTCSSPVLTYLDLSLLGGRGNDAADHLLTRTIEPRWK